MEYGITLRVRSEFFGDQIEGDSEILQKVSKLRHAGPFLIGKELGSGITGSVRLGTHVETGFKVALKIIKKRYLNKNPERWNTLRREIAVMKITEHPNIVKLYDVFETPEKIYLVTELITGGELFEHIPCEGLSRTESLRILAQITAALLHCHEYGIVHRDLKPENLLLDEHLNIKLGDFGMARLMKDGAMLKTSCGSPHYASPEVIDGKYDGKRSDVWSLGVILFAMLVGKLPFDHKNVPTLLMIVKQGEYEMPKSLDDDLKELIRCMIQVDVSKRIRMEDILNHRAFRKGSSPLALSRGLSSPSASSSVTPRALDSGDLIDREFGPAPFLDDSILEDLISLGWNSKEELSAKILRSEPSQEKSLYKHLERRRRSRLAELQRLSPRCRFPPSFSSFPSAPVTQSHRSPDSQRRSLTPSLGLPPTGLSKDGDVEMSIPITPVSPVRSDTKRQSAFLSSPYSPPSFPTSYQFSDRVHSPKRIPPPSPKRLHSPMKAEVSLKLFALANSRDADMSAAKKSVLLKRPKSARVLFPDGSGDHQQSGQMPDSPGSSPDRILSFTFDSPKNSPRRPQRPEDFIPQGPTSIISRWFSDFFRRRPSFIFDPWRESVFSPKQPSTQRRPSTPLSSPSTTMSSGSSQTCPSPSPSLSSLCPSSPSSLSSVASSSPSSSPSRTNRSLQSFDPSLQSLDPSLQSSESPNPSMSRGKRSSSLPIDILDPDIRRSVLPSLGAPKEQDHSTDFSLYSRQFVPRRKEPKPSNRASSMYIPQKEFEETE